jgi:hypothetical protein
MTYFVFMKVAVSIMLIISPLLVFSSGNVNKKSESEAYSVQWRIMVLSKKVNVEMMELSRYKNLKTFCSDDSYKETIFSLLDQIHTYHDLLEEDLHTTHYNHSRRTIKRLLRHMDKLDEKFNTEEFADFFKDQCSFQSQIEKHSKHYSAAFSSHSYGSRVYAQEVVMYRYLKRLTRRIQRIKKHVEGFYVRRNKWEETTL